MDATRIDLGTSDPEAFDLWGHQKVTEKGVTVDPEDRAIQYNFWVRYIGNSRIRLARTFRKYLLPAWIYNQDPSPSVENKIPLTKLKELYDHSPEEPGLTHDDRVSLRALERLLNGEFSAGVHPDSLYHEDDIPPE